MMIKKILIILTSITIIPVLFWAIKTTYGLFYILFELPKVMEGSVYSKENYVITLYRGAFGSTLYINGAQKDSKGYARYLEGILSDGTHVTVLVRGTRKGRFIFSNGHPPIEP